MTHSVDASLGDCVRRRRPWRAPFHVVCHSARAWHDHGWMGGGEVACPWFGQCPAGVSGFRPRARTRKKTHRSRQAIEMVWKIVVPTFAEWSAPQTEWYATRNCWDRTASPPPRVALTGETWLFRIVLYVLRDGRTPFGLRWEERVGVIRDVSFGEADRVRRADGCVAVARLATARADQSL